MIVVGDCVCHGVARVGIVLVGIKKISAVCVLFAIMEELIWWPDRVYNVHCKCFLFLLAGEMRARPHSSGDDNGSAILVLCVCV